MNRKQRIEHGQGASNKPTVPLFSTLMFVGFPNQSPLLYEKRNRQVSLLSSEAHGFLGCGYHDDLFKGPVIIYSSGGEGIFFIYKFYS